MPSFHSFGFGSFSMTQPSDCNVTLDQRFTVLIIDAVYRANMLSKESNKVLLNKKLASLMGVAISISSLVFGCVVDSGTYGRFLL